MALDTPSYRGSSSGYSAVTGQLHGHPQLQVLEVTPDGWYTDKQLCDAVIPVSKHSHVCIHVSPEVTRVYPVSCFGLPSA